MDPEIGHATRMLGLELKVRPIVVPIPLLDHEMSCFDHSEFERDLGLRRKFAIAVSDRKVIERQDWPPIR